MSAQRSISWEKEERRYALMNKIGHRLIKEGHLLSKKSKSNFFTAVEVYHTARFGWIWKVTTVDGMVAEIVKTRPVA